MTDTGPTDPYLKPDETARRLARQLARASGHAVLSCLEPGTGDPIASRVTLCAMPNGDPVLLVSGLSMHTRALAEDGRCSLLVGEPGRGDPLAHPRLMIRARAGALEPDAADARLARTRFLLRHPKAALYVDFPDFRFLRLEVTGGFLNAGFARATHLEASDLRQDVPDPLLAAEERVRSHMNEDHGDALDAILRHAGETGSGWRIATLDPLGFEAISGDRTVRVEFAEAVARPDGYRAAFVALARAAAG